MPRPRKVDRSIQKNIGIPESLATRLDLMLYSEVEGRIPVGAYQKFFTQLLQDHFKAIDRKEAHEKRKALKEQQAALTAEADIEGP